MLLNIIAPYPGLQDVYLNEVYPDRKVTVRLYSNNILLFLAMHIRTYLILRFLLNFTAYTSPRSQRLCMVYGKEADLNYAIKCVMKNKPYHFLALSLIVPMVIGGYCLRLFERELMASSG